MTAAPLIDRMARHRRVGFGAMHLSTEERPWRPVALAAVHAALGAGVRLLDTADAYCLDANDTGHNERLVAEAVREWDGPRHEVVVATKGGHVRDAHGGWDVDGDPDHLRNAARASRRRLGVDTIELYQFHRPDPAVPFGRSVSTLAELAADGVIRHAGVSNVDVAMAETAAAIVPLATVQDELSPVAPATLPVVAWCHRHGVGFLAWAPFGGRGRSQALPDDPALAAFATAAAERGLTVRAVVLGWLVSLSPVVMPIPGTSRPSAARANADVPELDAEALDALDLAVATGAAPGTVEALTALRARRPADARTAR